MSFCQTGPRPIGLLRPMDRTWSRSFRNPKPFFPSKTLSLSSRIEIAKPQAKPPEEGAIASTRHHVPGGGGGGVVDFEVLVGAAEAGNRRATSASSSFPPDASLPGDANGRGLLLARQLSRGGCGEQRLWARGYAAKEVAFGVGARAPLLPCLAAAALPACRRTSSPRRPASHCRPTCPELQREE